MVSKCLLCKWYFFLITYLRLRVSVCSGLTLQLLSGNFLHMAYSPGGEHIVRSKRGSTCLSTWQRACRWISGKDPVVLGYYPKAGMTPEVPTSPTGPTESRSSLISDLPTVLICSLSGTEESNCSLCGLNEMYLQLLGALFQNVPCYFSSRTSF